jgi:mRNA interferase MazF
MQVNIDLGKTQQYLMWVKDKLYLNSMAKSAANRCVKRGDVYRCNLGVGVGSEENKERPCVILQNNGANTRSPNTIIAPITHTTSSSPVVVPIQNQYDSHGKLLLDGNVLLGNVVCVSKARLGNLVTSLTNTEMQQVDKALAISIGILHHYEKLEKMYADNLVYTKKLKTKVDELTKSNAHDDFNP